MANVLYKGDTPLATIAPKDASELPYSNGVSVKDKIGSMVQAPNLSNITRENLTSATAVEITSTGKWYCVTAENQSSGTCSAYILDAANANYLSASQTPDGDWKRATTAWLYFPAGAKFYARAIFTYRGQLCSAPSL